jgi:hypothetical protein
MTPIATKSAAPRNDATCHFRTHALQQIATMFDAFTCRWRDWPQHQSLTTRSRQITLVEGVFECTDFDVAYLFERRQVAGAVPNTFLKAREKAASEL